MKLSEVTSQADDGIMPGFVSFPASQFFEYQNAAVFTDTDEAHAFARQFNLSSPESIAVVSSTLNGIYLVFIIERDFGAVSFVEQTLAFGLTYNSCVSATKKVIKENPAAVKAMGVSSIDDVEIADIQIEDHDDLLRAYS